MTRTISPLLALIVSGLFLSCANGQPCTLIVVTGLHVLITIDPKDGFGMGGSAGSSGIDCSPVVVATSEKYSEELICFSGDRGCECSGLAERTGTFTVTATLGEESEQKSVTLESNGCHVVPQTLTFF